VTLGSPLVRHLLPGSLPPSRGPGERRVVRLFLGLIIRAFSSANPAVRSLVRTQNAWKIQCCRHSVEAIRLLISKRCQMESVADG